MRACRSCSRRPGSTLARPVVPRGPAGRPTARHPDGRPGTGRASAVPRAAHGTDARRPVRADQPRTPRSGQAAGPLRRTPQGRPAGARPAAMPRPGAGTPTARQPADRRSTARALPAAGSPHGPTRPRALALAWARNSVTVPDRGSPGRTSIRYPGARVTIRSDAGPNSRRSRLMCPWIVLRALGGGASSQIASASAATDTTSPARSSNAASTVRSLSGSGTSRSPTATRTSPRSIKRTTETPK